MFIDESPINNNDNINQEILTLWREKLVNRVVSSKPYCNFLKSNTPLHAKLIATLTEAISINEGLENYELCGQIFNFRKEIINKNKSN